MMELLGVKIDAVNLVTALARVSDFLSSGRQHMIFTLNPEMLVAAERDSYFREILNESALNLCDGKGVEWVLKLKNNYNKLEKIERIAGIDFMLDICRLAAEEERSVYLLGAGDRELVRQAAKTLQEKFPKLKITGFHPGPRITYHITRNKGELREIKYEETENEVAVDDIILTAPDILFVAFGHEKQEKWIYEHLPHLPSVKISMGVGGAFDILGGKIRRAPASMRQLGLEWLWRLIQEPKRLRRIWTAVIVFPYLVIKN